MTVAEQIEKVATGNAFFLEDAIIAFEEMVKFRDYYKDEMKQLKSDLKRLDPDSSQWLYNQGKQIIISQHIEEINFIIDVLAGNKRK